MDRVRFTNTDSNGNPVTDRLAVTHDGERHEIVVAENGTAMVSEAVADYLVESPDYAVETYHSESDESPVIDVEDSDEESDPVTDETNDE